MGVVECLNHHLVEPYNVLYEKEGKVCHIWTHSIDLDAMECNIRDVTSGVPQKACWDEFSIVIYGNMACVQTAAVSHTAKYQPALTLIQSSSIGLSTLVVLKELVENSPQHAF